MTPEQIIADDPLEEEFRALEGAVLRRDHPERWLKIKGVRPQDLLAQFLRHHHEVSYTRDAFDILRDAIEWAYPTEAK